MSTINVGKLYLRDKLNIPTVTTAQRNALGNTAGLLVYNYEEEEVQINTGSGWIAAGIMSYGALFDFTTFTFTNAGVTQTWDGPTGQQVLNNYNTGANPWLTNNSFFQVPQNGIQRFTVPKDGSYRITAAGASGGPSGNGTRGGYGATMAGTFNLLQGQYLWIACGQRGQNGVSYYRAGAGGGASFAFQGSSLSGGTPLVIAAGGGGASAGYAGYIAGDHGESGNNGDRPGYYQAPGYCQPGAGFSNSSSGYGGTFPQGLKLGAQGGRGLYGSGGFGGGGDTYHSGGGGGGYTGGDVRGWYYSSLAKGDGGGSYNAGTNQSNTTGNRNGDGYVTVQFLG